MWYIHIMKFIVTKINELELCLSNVLPTVRNIVYTMTQFICKKRERKRELSQNYI